MYSLIKTRTLIYLYFASIFRSFALEKRHPLIPFFLNSILVNNLIICFFLYIFSGCQITLTKEMEGLEVELPKATRNFYVDGHKPKPH